LETHCIQQDTYVFRDILPCEILECGRDIECGNTQKWENIPCVITSFKDAVQNTSSNIEHILCSHEKPETNGEHKQYLF